MDATKARIRASPVVAGPAAAGTLVAEPQLESLFPAAALSGANVLAAVPSWWKLKAVEAGLDEPWTDWRVALSTPPADFDRTAPYPGLERASSFELGEAYSGLVEAGDRLKQGCHYTPQLLTTTLWTELEQAGETSSGPIADPACGAGALLIPALRRVLAHSSAASAEETLASASWNVRGRDLDPLAVWLGNAVLGAELLPAWASLPPARRQPLPRLLDLGDGLASSTPTNAVTVMNPPYGRVRLPAQERTRWAESLFGHANRFGLFLHAAIEMTTPGGLIGAVLPTSFLGGAYYQRLREFVAEYAPLARLVFVEERSGVFAGGVLQETCLAVFQRGGAADKVVCSTQPVNGGGKRRALGQIKLPRRRRDLPWLLPRTTRDQALVERAASLTARLSDYGWKASTGPLVWNRHKPYISQEPEQGAVPIVWAADLKAGRVERSRARAPQRWISLRERDAFMRLTDPAVLVQRTTAPEQARRLVVSVLDRETLTGVWGGTVVVENHVNVLRCTNSSSPLTPRLVAALLSSEPLDRLYRCLTGSVAVSAYELEALPLPPAEVLLAWQKEPTDEVARLATEFYG